MKENSFSLCKSEESINIPFLYESFDANLFKPKETKAWYESLLAVRKGETVNIYVPKESSVASLCLWLGNAVYNQQISFAENDRTGDIVLWFFDENLGYYREQYFVLDDSYDLVGTRKNPLIPEDAV